MFHRKPGQVFGKRKRAGQGLAESEAPYRQAIIAANAIPYSLDYAQGRYTFIGPGIEKLTGYSPEQLTPEILDSLILESIMQGDFKGVPMREAVARVRQGNYGQLWKCEHRIRTRSGEEHWFSDASIQVLDEAGIPKGSIGIFEDISERKQAEAMLRKLSSAIEQTADPVMITDVNGIIEYINPAFTIVTGFAAGEALGQTPRILKSGAYSSAFYKTIWDTILAGNPWLGTLVNRKKDGEIYFAETTIAPIISPQGIITDFVSVQKDITGRKRAESEILSRTNELSALYELSRDLAEATTLDQIFEIVDRHAVESVHTTFARIALLDNDDLLIRAAYPVRPLDYDLKVGERVPVSALPFCQRVMQQNEPVVIQAGNSEIDESERVILLLDFARALCLIPLSSGDLKPGSRHPLGLLMLGEARAEIREPFAPEKIRLARSIGDQAAVAIRRLLMNEQTERRLRQLAALGDIDRAITSSFDLYFSLVTLLSHVKAQLKVDAAAVVLFNPDSLDLEYAAAQGFRTKKIEHMHLRLLDGYSGRAIMNRHMVKIPDLNESQETLWLKTFLAGDDFVSYYGVPLISKGQIRGVLEIYQRTALKPDEEWLNFLNALGEQAAIAIDNATLFTSLQNSNTQLTLAYDATIEGWSRALDLRDKETEGHTQRVTEITLRLARYFGLSEAELVQVRWGALLHDIGKMGIPDGVLFKPGSLSDDEWVLMRKHPIFAYEMLSPIVYLRAALDIPYCHHEKWDGTGYPRGLKSEQIPLAARIFAVVDVWDALTSDRPYRAAWPSNKVLDHIRSLAGTHFDPKVVKLCLESGVLVKDE